MKHVMCLIAFLLMSMTYTNAQSEINSEQALNLLKDGNKRFASNTRKYEHLDADRIKEAASKGQFPFATIITCSDSRVPVEHVFDVGIGDVFVIRVAGNVINTDEAGSIEYGVEHLHTPVFVVLGHSSCGAVTAVVKDAHVHGNIPELIANISPAVENAKEVHGTAFSDELLETSIENNVWQSVEDLLSISEITKELVKDKKLLIIGAVYHLDTGKVEWLGEHPKQEELLRN